MSYSKNNEFHSGLRLKKMREIQGLSQIELADSLKVDVETLKSWEENAVPQDKLAVIQAYFAVSYLVFDKPIHNQGELDTVILDALFPQPSTDELSMRIAANRQSNNPTLDLSDLNLTTIPEPIFDHHWLVNLNLSNNNISFISSQLLCLPQLKQLNIRGNPKTQQPGFLSQSTQITLTIDEHGPSDNDADVSHFCVILLASLTHDHLAIADSFRAIQEPIYQVLLATTSDCQVLFDQTRTLSHVVYIGDDHSFTQLPTAINTLDIPWIHFNASDSKSKFIAATGQHAMSALISPRASLHSCSVAEYQSLFGQINHQDNRNTIKLIAIELINIGVYKNITIPINTDLSVFIGVNGSGKSTVLKSIILAILGPKKSAIGAQGAADLLQIKGKNGKNIQYQATGKITLTALVNGREYHNAIDLRFDNDTGTVMITGHHFDALFNPDGTLNSLILAIGEQRNTNSSNNNPITNEKPKVGDLLPILTGEAQSCISHFSSWLGNLALDVLNGHQQKQVIIDRCFSVFSAFMAEPIDFHGFTQADPMELWVAHQNPQQIVPLRLTSQGYQAVMGWVGYIIQRMYQAYRDCLQPFNQPCILIIDEIDQLLSVKWQQQILTVLTKQFFPRCQWIISSHSPMVITALDQAQVIQLHEKNHELVAEPNSVALWMWQYGDIIKHLFDIPNKPPEHQEQQIKQEIDTIESIAIAQRSEQHHQDLVRLKGQLEKIQRSRCYIDELYKSQQQLHQREKELVQLIKQLSPPATAADSEADSEPKA